ncbi:MAG: hypothetical protein KGH71_04915 [Candidatus Micrarchaeota archaeon]|nr:hypothetical protein [Candidatus Micrarchaeota archaeon]
MEQKQKNQNKSDLIGQQRKEFVATIVPCSNEFGEKKGDGWGKGPKTVTGEEKKEGTC